MEILLLLGFCRKGFVVFSGSLGLEVEVGGVGDSPLDSRDPVQESGHLIYDSGGDQANEEVDLVLKGF